MRHESTVSDIGAAALRDHGRRGTRLNSRQDATGHVSASLPSMSLLVIVVLLVGQLGFARDSAALTLLSFLISGVYAFAAPRRDVVLATSFLIPVNRVLTIGPISALSVMLIVYVLRFIPSRARAIDKGLLVCLACLGASSSVQAVAWSDLSVLADWAKMAVLLLVLFDVYGDVATRDQTAWDSIVCLGIGIVFAVFSQLLIDPSSVLSSNRFTFGEQGGQNVLAIECAFCLTSMLSRFCSGFKHNWTTLLLLAAVSLVGVLTASRSFFLGGIIGLAIITLGILGSLSPGRLLRAIAFLALAIVVVFFLFRVFPSIGDSFSYMYDRVVNPKNGDISNSRFDIWEDYLSALAASPQAVLFGVPSVGCLGMDIVAHNFIIEQIVSWGVVGNLFLVPLYVVVAVRGLDSSRIGAISLAPLLVLLFASFFSHTLYGIPQTFMFFASVYLNGTFLRSGFSQ